MWPAPSTSLPPTTGPAHASLRAFSSNNRSYKWPIEWPSFCEGAPEDKGSSLKSESWECSADTKSYRVAVTMSLTAKVSEHRQTGSKSGLLQNSRQAPFCSNKTHYEPLKTGATVRRAWPRPYNDDKISEKADFFSLSWHFIRVLKLEIIWGEWSSSWTQL